MRNEWRKSSFSGETNCLEVGRTSSGAVLLRCSREPAEVVSLTSEEFEAFLRGAREGEFDE